MKKKPFFYGTAYYAEYMPYKRICTDMELMKNAGINVIRIAESSWSTWEPQDNQFDFSLLHEVIRTADEYSISVIVGTPTYAIPTWLAKKYPDILVETHDGKSRYGHRQNMDITNPHYLFHAERIIRKLMEETASYSNVIGFQLDNETKTYDTCSSYAQAQFITYLKEKFSDLDILNDAFGLTYWSNRINSWEDFPDIRGTINASFGAEYERFQRKLVTDFLAWQSSIVQEYKKPEQFITQNFDYDWRDYSFGMQPLVNQFEATKCLTIPGFDMYHPSRDELTGAEISFGGAIGRSVAKCCGKENYFILETQAQGNLEWLPYKGQLRLQAYSHLANGAGSVLYWHWHSIHNAIESYWKGVLSHDLQENETYREVCLIGKEFADMGSKISNLKKKADIGILVNHDALTGVKWFPVGTLQYNDIVRWIYDAFYELNLECDILPPDTRDFSDYKLIVTPALYSASKELLEALKNYCSQGGHLLSTFKTGFCDENLKIYAKEQPAFLTECFGMTYDQFTSPKEVRLDGEMFERSIHVSEWMELLRPDDGGTEVWATYQHSQYKKYAAVTHHRYGHGSGTYLGCYFEKDGIKEVIQKLGTKIGLKIPDMQFPVIVKKGWNEDGELVTFYLNYSNSSQVITTPTESYAQKIFLYNGNHTQEYMTSKSSFTIEPWSLVICSTEEQL